MRKTRIFAAILAATMTVSTIGTSVTAFANDAACLEATPFEDGAACTEEAMVEEAAVPEEAAAEDPFITAEGDVPCDANFDVIDPAMEEQVVDACFDAAADAPVEEAVEIGVEEAAAETAEAPAETAPAEEVPAEAAPVEGAAPEAQAETFDDTLQPAVDAAAEEPQEMIDPELDMIAEQTEQVEEKPVCLGADSAGKFISMEKKAVQSSINGMLDMITKDCPELLPVFGPLKLVIGEMLGMNESKDPNAVIQEKLNEIDEHLTRMEESLRENMENIVALDSIGGAFQQVANAIAPLKNKIRDILNRYNKGKLTEAEKNSKIADLYSGSEYNSLAQALSAATNAYAGNTSYTLDKRSIFGAAYNLQCNSAMFSGEAVDCVTPYLLRQLCIYLKGYGFINTVLDAYETVNGEDAASCSRSEMLKNTGGYKDGKFDEKNPGVFGLYRAFFNTNRYIFLDKSSSKSKHVQLSEKLMISFHVPEEMLPGDVRDDRDKMKAYTPGYMSDFPLNADQMKRLAAYAAGKKMALYDYLKNTVGFKPMVLPTPTAMKLTKDLSVSLTTGYSIDRVVNFPGLGKVTFEQAMRKTASYMPTGRQYFTSKTGTVVGVCPTVPRFNYMQGINVNKVGAGDEKITVRQYNDRYFKSDAVNANLLYLVKPF